MINANDIIKLSDGIEYLVVSKVNYENNIYLCLISNDIKFVLLDCNKVVEVTDNDILDELLKLIIYNLTNEEKLI